MQKINPNSNLDNMACLGAHLRTPAICNTQIAIKPPGVDFSINEPKKGRHKGASTGEHPTRLLPPRPATGSTDTEQGKKTCRDELRALIF